MWEDRFKSVIVEDGVVARTMAAYIDSNPVRAGLVRAWGAHKGMAADVGLWAGEVSKAYRKFLMGNAVEKTAAMLGPMLWSLRDLRKSVA